MRLGFRQNRIIRRHSRRMRLKVRRRTSAGHDLDGNSGGDQKDSQKRIGYSQMDEH